MKIFAYSQGEYKDRPLYFVQLSPDGGDMKTYTVTLEQKGHILMYLNGLYRKDDPKDDEWVAEYELWCRLLFFWQDDNLIVFSQQKRARHNARPFYYLQFSVINSLLLTTSSAAWT